MGQEREMESMHLTLETLLLVVEIRPGPVQFIARCLFRGSSCDAELQL